MHSIFNNGLPLCLAGATCYQHLSLSKQIADHDRRREEIKRVQSDIRRAGAITADVIDDGEMRDIEIVVIRSLDLMILNLEDDESSVRHVPCTAKAA